MEPQRRKQAEPAKQGRPESIVTKKPLENQRKNKSDKHKRTKKTRKEKHERRERERERDKERQKRKAKGVNQKFVIIDNDLCGSSSLSALRKLDVPIIAHLWKHKEENKQNLQNKEDQKA